MKELTPRQTQVEAILLHQPELCAKEIAHRLGIRRNTVEHHTFLIYRNRGVRSRAGLVYQAAMAGRLTANGNGA
jgi:DNA-binding NarL/FixJ family response regulator